MSPPPGWRADRRSGLGRAGQARASTRESRLFQGQPSPREPLASSAVIPLYNPQGGGVVVVVVVVVVVAFELCRP